MFIEIMLGTITPGKVAEAEEQWKGWAQYNKNQGIKSRVLRPETGRMDRIFLENEFESAVARAEFYKTHTGTDEFKALVKEFREKAYTVPGDFEHYYYYITFGYRLIA